MNDMLKFQKVLTRFTQVVVNKRKLTDANNNDNDDDDDDDYSMIQLYVITNLQLYKIRTNIHGIFSKNVKFRFFSVE